MDWSAVSVVTPADGLAITAVEMRDHLRIRSAVEDSYVESLIRAATTLIDGPSGIGAAMLPQSWRYALDAFPSGVLRLPGRGIASVASVNYVDETGGDQVMAPADYRLVAKSNAARIEAVGVWPETAAQIGAVWVDYQLGGTADEGLKQALRLIVAHWYENREEFTNIGQMTQIPMGAKNILMRHNAQLVG